MPDDVVKLLDRFIEQATTERASDIHIEPREEYVRVRFRVDGLLQDIETIPKQSQPALISRIKVMVNLDIAESRLPQDGRGSVHIGKSDYDLRVSTLPTVHGEKAVIRILERRRVALKLEELGLDAADMMAYRRMISRRSGLLLITGPTGSGKTTTLYASLKELNCRENNIITIEDPVEYQLPGINQVQVNQKSGLTFARILRSVLRQDPDIIMVGEIRDLETARIAVQAALTGHLVLATLHTRDALSSTIRLCEMGIEGYLIKDCIVGAVAQRLIRIKPSGRRAIFEIMEGCEPREGMKTMKDKALELIKQGTTSREEVERAVCFDQ
ncbi:MAG TPA: GspE/PulE family protein [Candidatus Omnitrophota bacterium]|nr:GspE/PulE family protein [Candidatus Omnitrophota bacterium]